MHRLLTVNPWGQTTQSEFSATYARSLNLLLTLTDKTLTRLFKCESLGESRVELTGASLAALLLFSSVAATALVLFAAAWFGPDSRRTQRMAHASEAAPESIAFLFDRTALVDATRPAERLISAAPMEGSDWGRLLALLSPEFPDFAKRIEALPGDGVQTYESKDASTRLTAEWRDGLCRVTLIDQDVDLPSASVDAQSYSAMERELETLKANTDITPFPVWRQDKEGRVTWVNRAYVDILRKVHGPEGAQRWPTPALFDVLTVAESEGFAEPLRIALDAQQNGELWFDVHAVSSGDELLCTAVNVDQVVDSKRQLQAFTQTLTKTFADLAVGLAIFDRSRRLQLFNPALADLTELPFGFLVANPTLHRFLDKMRDMGRVPEPRNYTAWRTRIADLELSASDGHFCETWTLSNGQTLRVTGRPHPDGALAFIFEDISAEISLTRRFRAELEAGRSVFDHFDEAIAVFSPSGVLTMANSAYAGLWGHSPMSSVEQAVIGDVSDFWAENTLPSAVWDRATAFIHAIGDRDPWTSDVNLRDGRAVTCRFVPLNGGSTLVGFTPHVASSGDVRFRRRAG